ncbi:ATP-binding cassette subfamily C protein/ATP-binding cassette subfamily C exporter for protease/lipase/ATP-binding cassette subfamily C protein EexD [Mesorhizobium sp. J18]|uniref:type I secretion system permease/ATPase n=1 Tax=Mesorhizobium sp. J18 TaxID=935263 RepID=UPI00119956D5|nr:type I secretion system permease/ATPase [Mesorhizobium sp. J18]TWG89836.1 ATP-binding cassette subfamily C protein/ATP-binding cassette subfamily C exporter for protease/lipase/ATP-binding cassette subfamily C protein EexD [Mesorhizobium sp. J18]
MFMADAKSISRSTEKQADHEINAAIKSLRLHFAIVGIFSSAINLLYLSSPLYLMQVYNRVLVSESIPTLVLLTLILVIALAVMAVLDAARTQILIRCGILLDQKLSGRLFSALVQKSSRQGFSLGAQPLRELDEFRTFITGPGIYFAFDLPWIPLYLGLLYFIHPVLGVVATIGAILLLGLAFLNEFVTRKPIENAQGSARRAFTFTENIMQHADVIRAMGMQSAVERHWQGSRIGMLRQQAFASDRNAWLSASIRFARLLLQSLMLGTGAWLALDHAIMPATIFAASIIMGRALVPVEQSVSAWKQAVTARLGYKRVRDILKENPATDLKTIVPVKQTALEVKDLAYQAMGRKKPILEGITFRIGEGEVLGIVGPSGSGKSTLAKLLIGALQPSAGEISFGGLNYSHWDPLEFGRITGYLPQDVGLFAGTVRENIARFGDPSVEEVIEAATLAGIHEMILSLPKQYDTMLGPGGLGLSGGQRQRIGLARALLGRPKLLVLDEPNAHLDVAGEKALSDALFVMKAQGTAIVVITHQPAILRVVDTVLTLKSGRMDKLGSPESFSFVPIEGLTA